MSATISYQFDPEPSTPFWEGEWTTPFWEGEWNYLVVARPDVNRTSATLILLLVFTSNKQVCLAGSPPDPCVSSNGSINYPGDI